MIDSQEESGKQPRNMLLPLGNNMGPDKAATSREMPRMEMMIICLDFFGCEIFIISH